MERTSECQLPERKKDDDECGDYRPADGRSRQQHPEVDSTRRRRPDFRHSRLDNRPYLQGGTALSGSLRLRRRDAAHVRPRHPGGQGGLPESRSHGLRQPLWHGVLFRGRLHGQQPRPTCHADRGQHRQGEERQSTVGFGRGGASSGQGGDAGRASRHRSYQAGCDRSRSRCSRDQQSAAQTADVLFYSSITTVARRPGTTASWTQNWPLEPLVGNSPTTSTFRWTWISFCFTFFAFGAVLFIYERYLNDPDQAPMDPVLAKFEPLTASQRRVGKYFLVVAAILLLQILVGSIMAHYYTDRTSFYGIEIDRFLPFNFLRDVHIQSPIVWIGLSWIGAGLFLAPAISGGEPKGQGFLVDLLFWVTLFIVVGALAGNYLGIMGYIREGWFWFGNQGLSYIQLGRFWQIGFFAGLALWSLLVFRALWPTRAKLATATRQFWTGRIRLEHLLWASTVNIALLYVFGMIPLTGVEKSFTITDFWLWWVVHLWVEQSFEFFAAAISAYLLMAVGLVSRQLAERSVYFELILIFLGGVLGTGHHLYWAGGPDLWVPLGSMFSFIEVLPLVLLIISAIQHHRLIKAHGEFKYGLAYTYIVGAAFWNFVGAGVFGGGTLNAPLVNYYEHGTFLTLNHAHTALFGAFGLLGIGLIYFCLRYLAGDRYSFREGPGYTAFWLYNAGLVLWITLNFFPIGWSQLNAVFEHGFAYARSLAFYDTMLTWQWLRIPGDVVFALGALLMAWDFIVKLRPLFPRFIAHLIPSARAVPGAIRGAR